MKKEKTFITYGTEKYSKELNFNHNNFYTYGEDYTFLKMGKGHHRVSNLDITYNKKFTFNDKFDNFPKGITLGKKELHFLVRFNLFYKLYLLFKMLFAKNFVFVEVK